MTYREKQQSVNVFFRQVSCAVETEVSLLIIYTLNHAVISLMLTIKLWTLPLCGVVLQEDKLFSPHLKHQSNIYGSITMGGGISQHTSHE